VVALGGSVAAGALAAAAQAEAGKNRPMKDERGAMNQSLRFRVLSSEFMV
jgi:hypothetical protein